VRAFTMPLPIPAKREKKRRGRFLRSSQFSIPVVFGLPEKRKKVEHVVAAVSVNKKKRKSPLIARLASRGGKEGNAGRYCMAKEEKNGGPSPIQASGEEGGKMFLIHFGKGKKQRPRTSL